MHFSVRGPQVRIRDSREALGLSVNRLVERIKETGYTEKLHADTIRNIELGHKRGSKPLMTAWAKALGLMPLDVWQPPTPAQRKTAARAEQVPA